MERVDSRPRESIILQRGRTTMETVSILQAAGSRRWNDGVGCRFEKRAGLNTSLECPFVTSTRPNIELYDVRHLFCSRPARAFSFMLPTSTLNHRNSVKLCRRNYLWLATLLALVTCPLLLVVELFSFSIALPNLCHPACADYHHYYYL